MKQPSIYLRKSESNDLEHFFGFQLEPSAIFMAAFTPKDPTNRTAYMEKYAKLLQEPSINMQTIIYENRIVGSISKFIMEGVAEITYWISQKDWGKGIATHALQHFLTLEKTRPIYGRTVFDNTGSQRVLLNNGFIKVGEDKGFAYARQTEVQEFIFRLD